MQYTNGKILPIKSFLKVLFGKLDGRKIYQKLRERYDRISEIREFAERYYQKLGLDPVYYQPKVERYLLTYRMKILGIFILECLFMPVDFLGFLFLITPIYVIIKVLTALALSPLGTTFPFRKTVKTKTVLLRQDALNDHHSMVPGWADISATSSAYYPETYRQRIQDYIWKNPDQPLKLKVYTEVQHFFLGMKILEGEDLEVEDVLTPVKTPKTSPVDETVSTDALHP